MMAAPRRDCWRRISFDCSATATIRTQAASKRSINWIALMISRREWIGLAAAGCLLGQSDPAMEPPKIQIPPGPEYADAERKFQGIPGVERAANGRLWVTWYTGDTREGPQNYVLLATSSDDGKTWSAPSLVIDPPGFV